MIVIPTNAYPLTWPASVPREKYQSSSKFGRVTGGGGSSVRRIVPRENGDGIKMIRTQLKHLNAETIVISSNLPLRSDGLPYSDGPQNPRGDIGVAVYWTRFEVRGPERKRQLIPYCMPCDKWNRIGDNLYAIGLSIEAMRGMDRWGCVSVEQAFAGFAALPPGSSETSGPAPALTWREVLSDGRPWPEGLDLADMLQVVKGRYKTMIGIAHPDRGGSEGATAILNAAMAQAEKELGG